MPFWLKTPTVVRAVLHRRLSYLDRKALCELHDAVRAIERRRIDGVLIEAGCALGGSAIVMAAAKSSCRALEVYDVFGRIPPPSVRDGADVHERYRIIAAGKAVGVAGDLYYGYRHDLLAKVMANFDSCGIQPEANKVRFIPGLFHDTLRSEHPVALAHIDGDWYDSVMTCLERIEPRLALGGTLVIDDYHHWSGCRDAVDDYFAHKREYFKVTHNCRLHITRVARLT